MALESFLNFSVPDLNQKCKGNCELVLIDCLIACSLHDNNCLRSCVRDETKCINGSNLIGLINIQLISYRDVWRKFLNVIIVM